MLRVYKALKKINRIANKRVTAIFQFSKYTSAAFSLYIAIVIFFIFKY